MKSFVFDGKLTVDQLVEISREPAGASVASHVPEQLVAWHQAADRIAERQPIYGRSTGVGANRLTATATDLETHGRNLVRTHAVDAGESIPAEQVRSMLAVRLNQLIQGGSGIDPEIPFMLVRMLDADALPDVRVFSGVGTADLSALAGTALAMLGERPLSGPIEPLTEMRSDSALPFMSSSALTIGRAALVTAQLETVIRAQEKVFVLSAAASLANDSAFSPEAARAIPTDSAAEIAARLAHIHSESAWTPLRIQDPYAFRAFLATHDVAVEAIQRLHNVTERLMNTAQENPLFLEEPEMAVHHGAFHQAALAHELDSVAVALAQCAPILISRLKMMNDDAMTGLPKFLAPDAGGRSGTMIVEYVAASVMGDVLSAAQPMSIQTTVLSCGVEDDASFATTAVRQLEQSAQAYQILVGSELLVASRALRLRKESEVSISGPLKKVVMIANQLDPRCEDRDLRADLDLATELVARLGLR